MGELRIKLRDKTVLAVKRVNNDLRDYLLNEVYKDFGTERKQIRAYGLSLSAALEVYQFSVTKDVDMEMMRVFDLPGSISSRELKQHRSAFNSISDFREGELVLVNDYSKLNRKIYEWAVDRRSAGLRLTEIYLQDGDEVFHEKRLRRSKVK